MASIEVRLPPDLGDGKLIEWIKHPGERVEIDDVLFELETDKTTVQCIAPAAGVLSKIFKSEGDSLIVDDLVAIIDSTVSSDGAVEELNNPSSDASTNERQDDHSTPTPKSNPQSLGSMEDTAVLSISIAGRWTARDFADFYCALCDLYLIFSLLELESASIRDQENEYRSFIREYASGMPESRHILYLNALHRGMAASDHHLLSAQFLVGGEALLSESERLTVLRCVFASPGDIDFLGIGAALGHIKDIIFKFVDVREGRRIKELDIQARQDELERNRRESELKTDLLREEVKRSALETERKILENERGALDNEKQVIENCSAKIAILEKLRALGYSDAQARKVIADINPALVTVDRLVSAGLLKDASMRPKETKL